MLGPPAPSSQLRVNVVVSHRVPVPTEPFGCVVLKLNPLSPVMVQLVVFVVSQKSVVPLLGGGLTPWTPPPWRTDGCAENPDTAGAGHEALLGVDALQTPFVSVPALV